MPFSEFSELDMLLDVVVKKNFQLISLGWYLIKVVIENKYPPSCSNENASYDTGTGNVVFASWVIPVVTIPFLDLVTIHNIR